MADVFVSYKKEDRALAESVIAQLDTAGFSVWWDQRLTPRDTWDDLIKRELDAAKAVLVLWTTRSVNSEWVRIEAEYAKGLNKLIPAKLEACGVPLAFRLRQTADLSLWDGAADFPEWTKTLQWLRDLVGEPEKLAARRIVEEKKREDEIVLLQAEVTQLKAELAQLREKPAAPPPLGAGKSGPEPPQNASSNVSIDKKQANATLQVNAAATERLFGLARRRYPKLVVCDGPMVFLFLNAVLGTFPQLPQCTASRLYAELVARIAINGTDFSLTPGEIALCVLLSFEFYIFVAQVFAAVDTDSDLATAADFRWHYSEPVFFLVALIVLLLISLVLPTVVSLALGGLIALIFAFAVILLGFFEDDKKTKVRTLVFGVSSILAIFAVGVMVVQNF